MCSTLETMFEKHVQNMLSDDCVKCLFMLINCFQMFSIEKRLNHSWKPSLFDFLTIAKQNTFETYVLNMSFKCIQKFPSVFKCSSHVFQMCFKWASRVSNVFKRFSVFLTAAISDIRFADHFDSGKTLMLDNGGACHFISVWTCVGRLTIVRLCLHVSQL